MSTVEGTRVPPTTYDDLPPAAKAAHDAPHPGRPHHQHETDAAAFGAGVRGADDLVSAARHGAAVPGRAAHHSVRPRGLQRNRLPDLLDLLPPGAGRNPARIPTGWCSTSGNRRWLPSGGASPPRPTSCRTQVYRPLAERLSREQIVALTAFGALMVATNVFNNALRVPTRRVSRAVPQGARHVMGECSGKVAFVTGAAHGQGRASALALAGEGARRAGLRRRAAAPLPRLRAWERPRTWSASPPSAGRRWRVRDVRRRRARRRRDPRRGRTGASPASAGSTSCSTTPGSAPTGWPTS